MIMNSSDSRFESLHLRLATAFSACSGYFNAVHINAQSIAAHYPDLLCSFDNTNIQAVLVSETFLKPEFSSTIVDLPGFTLIRNDRIGRVGGGVAIYLRSHISYDILSNPAYVPGRAEHLFLEVNLGSSKLLLGVYYSPESRINYFDSLNRLLIQYVPVLDHTIIMGDFNTCLLKGNSRKDKLNSIVNSNNLSILPLEATHNAPKCRPSLLDLIVVSSTGHVRSHGQLAADAFSYHDLVFVSYNIACQFEGNPHGLNPVPWLTPEIKQLMYEANAAKANYKSSPESGNHKIYRKMFNKYYRKWKNDRRRHNERIIREA